MTQPTSANADPESSPPLLVDDRGGVRTLTFNRPGAFNSFDLALKDATLAGLTAAAADDSVRAVVITGAGRAFSAGQDLKEHLELVRANDSRIATTVRDFYNVAISLITSMPKPVIAAVNGTAAGAGAAFAYACDLRIAAEPASFSMAFAGVGLSADSGASFILPRLVGAGRASRMMLLGERVDAAEALRIGLVDEVVPSEDLMNRVNAVAQDLAQGPTRAYAWIKASLHHAWTSDLASALEFENGAQSDLFASADHHEAIAAFVAKRPPRFQGR
ncbi:2-(1,2-epoxy-1,2-dihydrophenyl)acetyl-CoA isomerase [Nakamurella panacisegetis]|uniref:2-(1,2-epoxy-1,2-dihydrophenyl)acetyl-CoA isomerase n=1 Tax=Nakamurella panacisegetis TaxID=1090615 RepID=A0A1H0SM17_9ACTN|nr:enoyl-CoA hydratase-related protein [Nakamurella panacisegetis]SDP42774.1 2-(1,2-epoxy-1,2-dihydrophenyl)acetyl-CoA isomerase [Nakamurella panacisegetis]